MSKAFIPSNQGVKERLGQRRTTQPKLQNVNDLLKECHTKCHAKWHFCHKMPLSSQKCQNATNIGKTGENRGSEVQSAFCEVQSTFGRASHQVGCETCGNWRIGFPDQASPKLAKLAVDSVCVCHAGGSRRFSVSRFTLLATGWG